MHVIPSEFMKERRDGHTHFRAKSATACNLTICEHAPGDGERYTCIKSSRANPPTTIRQHHGLVRNLYLLAPCLASNNNAQHVAILWLDILSRNHFQQAGQHFTRGYPDTTHVDRLITAKAQVNQKLQFCHKVGREGYLERDITNALVAEREWEGCAFRMQGIDSCGTANWWREDYFFLSTQSLLGIPFTILEDLRLPGKFVENRAYRIWRNQGSR